MTSVHRSTAVATRPAGPQAVELKGKVQLRTVGGVSKSRHTAIVMTVKGKTIEVQRRNGNPFMIDAKERSLVGKQVALKGFFVSDHLFRFTEAKIAKPKI